MPSQNPHELSPSQLFEQNKDDLVKLFKEETSKLPKKINRYQIIEELGRGGMGCVYKAYDPQMNKFVALKVILTNQTQVQEKELERFIREAKAMAKMSHPNVVRIYDTGKDNGCPFIIMDYVEGRSLKNYLQNSPLNVRLFSQLIVKISRAIAYAHDRGTIHRDLKPANIMIDKALEPQVMDFGLVKLTASDRSLSKKGTIIGTPQYMSPEQAKGAEINHLTDVYALGAIFYEMLSGQPLVQGQSVAEIIYKVINTEPKLLRQVNGNLSIDLETICSKTVEKELEKRYQSANDFADDIDRFLNGELITARAANIWQRVWNKLKKNKLVMLTLVVGILLIVGTWLFEKQYYKAEVYLYLAKAKKLQQQIDILVAIDKKMETYTKVSSMLEKALEVSPNNFAIRSKLIKMQEKMGLLAKKQKNYLLSFTLFQQCKTLGYKQANKLLFELEEEKRGQEKKDMAFISKVMDKIGLDTPEALINRYVFAIVKMQKAYVIKKLVPYLKMGNKWQRLMAVKALGKLGNTYTKYKGKDSVEYLLGCLEKFKNKELIENNQREVEEIIWALGWLKDARANHPVYKLRWLAGQNGLLWKKTKMPYKWIPIEKKALKKNTVSQFVVSGNMKKEKGNYIGAIADYSKAIDLNPKNSSVYSNRGNAYFKMKEHSKALADFNKAIALDPKYSSAYNNRGNAYFKMKEHSKALVDYNKAIALDPKYSLAYSNRGNVYQEIKEHSKAIADFSKTIDLNPKYSTAYNNRGLVYQEIKEYSKALDDFSKVIALDPKYPKAYNNRGSTYRKIKEYSKALADFSKAIDLNPKNSIAYSNRGNVYQDLKKYSKALSEYNKAIDLNPKRATTYNNKGNIYHSLKKYLKAIANYNKAIALDPKYPEAYNNRGSAYRKMKEYSKTIANYSKAIDLNPKYFKAYISRGNTYKLLKEYSKALADYNKAIILHPKYFLTYYNRGNTYLTLKENSKALADYNKAIILNPKHSKTYSNRGDIYRRVKEYSKAITSYNKAIDLNPKLSVAYLNRGRTYLSSKQHQKAYYDFQIFLKLTPNHPFAPKVRATISYLRKNNLIK